MGKQKCGSVLTEKGGEAGLALTFDLAGAIDKVIVKELNDIGYRLEPAKPVPINDGFACGGCGKALVLHARFCHWCGKKVKWE